MRRIERMLELLPAAELQLIHAEGAETAEVAEKASYVEIAPWRT